jgi:hypothetical protein
MTFNRADDVSLVTCLRRLLGGCLLKGHDWSAPWWARYLERERRVCARCGLVKERDL